MASTKSKGNYYKYKTKKYFESLGYKVEYLEVPQRVFDPKSKKVFYVKKDMLGADLLAYNKTEFILVQVKLNKKNVAEGIKEFMKYEFPDCISRWIIVWKPRAKDPEIININEIEYD